MRVNRSKGNMYDWVTHTWGPIVGCQHQCQYCYVKAFRDQPVEPVWSGPLPFPKLGQNRVIFVGHLCDMFAENVPASMIQAVLAHCDLFPENTYVFQTKNPERLVSNLRLPDDNRPMIGTTIETNREELLASISKAPTARDRANALWVLGEFGYRTFLTVEPILDFDLEPFVELIVSAHPNFINIGADSKGHGLPEPTRAKVVSLAEALGKRGIEIRKKVNLARLAT